mmetsp:Transcript_64099/g.169903  ORF Transcript_64099/g.169903 Transcript_64099/m.169903 type:complete len:234 (-) Transcript_64099:620-1321(-)
MLRLVEHGTQRATKCKRRQRLSTTLRIHQRSRWHGLEAVDTELRRILPHELVAQSLAHVEITICARLDAMCYTRTRRDDRVLLRDVVFSRTVVAHQFPSHALEQFIVTEQFLPAFRQIWQDIESVHQRVPEPKGIKTHSHEHVTASRIIVDSRILSRGLNFRPIRRGLHLLPNLIPSRHRPLVQRTPQHSREPWILQAAHGKWEHLRDERWVQGLTKQQRGGEVQDGSVEQVA